MTKYILVQVLSHFFIRVDPLLESNYISNLSILYSIEAGSNSVRSYIRPSDKRGIEMARYRNMRSKRQCSLCLQFALILGAGPVLHRPTSLVIHRLEWNLTRFFYYIKSRRDYILFFNDFSLKVFRAVVRVFTLRLL